MMKTVVVVLYDDDDGVSGGGGAYDDAVLISFHKDEVALQGQVTNCWTFEIILIIIIYLIYIMQHYCRKVWKLLKKTLSLSFCFLSVIRPTQHARNNSQNFSSRT